MEKNNANNANNKKQEAGALWQKTSKTGKKFFSGYIIGENGEKIKIVGFENIYKKAGENSPDLRLYLSEEIASSKEVSSEKQIELPKESSSVSEDDSEDIPF